MKKTVWRGKKTKDGSQLRNKNEKDGLEKPGKQKLEEDAQQLRGKK
jgi:hypothetical protein